MNTLFGAIPMRTLAFLLIAVLPAWADKKPEGTATAQDVVKASIKATGGEELIKKLQCASMKMKGEMTMMGLELEFTGDMLYAPPDKMRMKMNMAIMGQKIAVEQVLNGKKMKATMNGNAMPLDEDTADDLRDNFTEHELSQLVPLLDEKKFKIKLGDDVDVDGKAATAVVVSGESLKDRDVTLYFDKTTNLVVKMKRKGKEPGTGKEVTEETIISDYKDVQKLMTPHKMSIKHDGKAFMTLTLSEIKHMEKIDEKEFSIDD
jgi:hypothetical protein